MHAPLVAGPGMAQESLAEAGLGWTKQLKRRNLARRFYKWCEALPCERVARGVIKLYGSFGKWSGNLRQSRAWTTVTRRGSKYARNERGALAFA